MQRGILEQMKEAEPIHKKHYMQSSKDKSVSAGMVFKKKLNRQKFRHSLRSPPQGAKQIQGRWQNPTLTKNGEARTLK